MQLALARPAGLGRLCSSSAARSSVARRGQRVAAPRAQQQQAEAAAASAAQSAAALQQHAEAAAASVADAVAQVAEEADEVLAAVSESVAAGAGGSGSPEQAAAAGVAPPAAPAAGRPNLPVDLNHPAVRVAGIAAAVYVGGSLLWSIFKVSRDPEKRRKKTINKNKVLGCWVLGAGGSSRGRGVARLTGGTSAAPVKAACMRSCAALSNSPAQAVVDYLQALQARPAPSFNQHHTHRSSLIPPLRRPWWTPSPSTCPATARGSAAARSRCSRCRRVRGGAGGARRGGGRGGRPRRPRARSSRGPPGAHPLSSPCTAPMHCCPRLPRRLLQRRDLPQVPVVPAARAAVGRGGAGRPGGAQGRAGPGRRAGGARAGCGAAGRGATAAPRPRCGCWEAPAAQCIALPPPRRRPACGSDCCRTLRPELPLRFPPAAPGGGGAAGARAARVRKVRHRHGEHGGPHAGARRLVGCAGVGGEGTWLQPPRCPRRRAPHVEHERRAAVRPVHPASRALPSLTAALLAPRLPRSRASSARRRRATCSTSC